MERRPGYVYFIREKTTGSIKIGRTIRPSTKIFYFRHTCGNGPTENYKFVAVIKCNWDFYFLERWIQIHFIQYQADTRSSIVTMGYEWFDVPSEFLTHDYIRMLSVRAYLHWRCVRKIKREKKITNNILLISKYPDYTGQTYKWE